MTRGIAVDLTGKKSGFLTVLYRVESDKASNAQWLCRCGCGNHVVIRSMYLKKGKQKFCSKQCPYYTRPMRCDYAGKRFGRLTAIMYVKSSKGGEAIWRYRCDCGSETELKHYSVKIGHTQSCGCLAKEVGNYRNRVNNNLLLYKPTKRLRTPRWLTVEQKRQIRELYSRARKLSKDTGTEYHVDHIYPLRGRYSSGLHVPWNLQIITSDDNLHKSNKEPEDICWTVE